MTQMTNNRSMIDIVSWWPVPVPRTVCLLSQLTSSMCDMTEPLYTRNCITLCGSVLNNMWVWICCFSWSFHRICAWYSVQCNWDMFRNRSFDIWVTELECSGWQMLPKVVGCRDFLQKRQKTKPLCELQLQTFWNRF